MESRINPFALGQNAMKVMYGFATYLSKSSIEKNLLELIYLRVSQINGCAYCLDMHAKDLRAAGETEQRLYLLNAWRETDLYTERECAALAFAEAVTKLSNGHVPNEVYSAAAEQFTDTEMIELTMAVIAINSYNRVNITFGVKGGSYVVGQHAAPATQAV
ncbi:carboxymuconolactone decarboxylase family protein [Mucilaginibacter agri]|uniref:Carboxymuconolactone decarboxylase family protein n=1 Tax=Mucilaginibacter agri TaxID=2695265 RepID=A0A966DTL3_9SPHI|nr:carboxymuconolactone decarboxylase family protein [Mucilaginibacter agri]NCD69536.1 carboxymuconolactone decarboxylase family protein [Mucilaginibacter agri]